MAENLAKAIGANLICMIVPCHRVVGKTGKLTGYGGGIENKKQLLLLEKTEKEKFNFLSFEKTKKYAVFYKNYIVIF